ncbi:FAD-dependent oxidoreductase [Thalassospira lucentensis]|uniref:FAD-dependent oxidoreductase n=1 Tax=Thalassospira lucentensis TaxID=168935 RepID=UPI003D2F08D5
MLRQHGAKLTVLEAKPHIGGRLLTDWSMGAPFEVGAGTTKSDFDDLGEPIENRLILAGEHTILIMLERHTGPI